MADDTTTWVDPNGRTLSDRIWGNKQAVRQEIDRTLRRGLAEGWTTDQTATALLGYISPAHGGNAKAGAERLVLTETARANALATRETARADPATRYLRYEVSERHIVADECSDLAARDDGHGAGVYRIEEAPMPPRHPRCACVLSPVRVDSIDLTGYARQLRVAYGLDDEPADLTPAELAEYRRQTGALREQVTLLWRGWFRQTGLVTEDQLVPSGSRVRDWVAAVRSFGRRLRR